MTRTHAQTETEIKRLEARKAFAVDHHEAELEAIDDRLLVLFAESGTLADQEETETWGMPA